MDFPLFRTLTPWRIRQTDFIWGQRTYILGILNTTPDSFSDGGQFNTLPLAIAQARQMIQDGVDGIDIGGQSTRPGAQTITLQEELDRTIPVIEALRQETEIPISIDTTRAEVAQAALEAGADIINDISGGIFDPNLLAIAAKYEAPLILMHLRGTPATMQTLTQYDDVVGEVVAHLQKRIDAAEQAGIPVERLMVDPGIGFAKTVEQNITLVRQLGQFKSLGVPLLVGPSRKSFLGAILNEPDPQKRVWGTGAACCAAIAQGADMVRVHDVAAMVQICRVADALWR